MPRRAYRAGQHAVNSPTLASSSSTGQAQPYGDAGQPMPGGVEVAVSAAPSAALEDLLLLIGATRDDEWSDQVKFVPLR